MRRSGVWCPIRYAMWLAVRMFAGGHYGSEAKTKSRVKSMTITKNGGEDAT